METSQKASAGQTCFSQSTGIEGPQERGPFNTNHSEATLTILPSSPLGPWKRKGTELAHETDLISMCAIN